MINRKEFALMRREMEQFDKLREGIIKESRDVLKASKAAIYSIHRSDLPKANEQLKSAKNKLKKIQQSINKKSLAALRSIRRKYSTGDPRAARNVQAPTTVLA